MRIFETERVIIDQVGSRGGEAYLLRTPEHSLLYDSGFAYSAPAMVCELEDLLEEQTLDYVFLSHSHYDHASGSVWVKQRWPEAVVLGSAHAARVLERPGARETMKELNKEAVKDLGDTDALCADCADAGDFSLLDKLSVDRVVEDGDLIDMGSVTFVVVAAPGHTRCSITLWCPEEQLLISSESIGVMVNSELVVPTYLTGYQDSLNTIARARELEPLHILLNHKQVISGDEAKRYLENSLYWAKEAARRVWEGQAEGKTTEELTAMLKEIFYPEDLRAFQPEAAFDLNNGYVVDQLLSCAPKPH